MHPTVAGLTIRNRHFFSLDLIAWCATAVGAIILRTEHISALQTYAPALSIYLIIAVFTRFITFRAFGLYARYWRYASVEDLFQLVLAVGTATALLSILFTGILPFLGLLETNLPRSIPLIDGILVLFVSGGLRSSPRLAEQLRRVQRSRTGNLKRVVIFGAGDAGTMIVREMQRNPKLGLEPVAFLDADPAKKGMWILGLPVEGDRTKLGEVIHKYNVQEAIIAIPSASGKTIRELTHLCQNNNLPVKTLPSWNEFLNARRAVNQLRPVDITDLLRREPIQTDMSQIAQLLQGKRVLVTGAGGSIGSEICRQVAHCTPAELVLLGHGENSIFEIYHELQRIMSSTPRRIGPVLRPVIADVRDAARMQMIFARYQPHIVFHAAAHKHVPLMEENLEEAVTNNVLGTRNLIEYARETDIEHFVLISTDKAVNPTSVMGATKRIAEMLIQNAAARTGKNFVAVRFGNVLNSRGSVVPLFKQQLAQGGPLTITHPEIRRYFMTIPEAVQLVLQTTVLCKAGAIYVLDMGEPIKIVDLARDLIRLSGLEPDDIPIEFTGLRPGEKLYEELFVAGEQYTRTAHAKILAARNGMAHTLDETTRVAAQIDTLIVAAQTGKTAQARELLRALVPEYQPTQTGNDRYD